MSDLFNDGLRAAAEACESLVHAIDGGGKPYVREALASQCAKKIRAMITTADDQSQLASAVAASHKDAERWQLARKYLSIEDIENWDIEMKGHQPDEAENLKSDEAIDAAIRSQGEGNG